MFIRPPIHAPFHLPPHLGLAEEPAWEGDTLAPRHCTASSDDYHLIIEGGGVGRGVEGQLLASYIREHLLASPALPRRILPHSSVGLTPSFHQRSYAECVDVDLYKPQPGTVRLFSDALVDRALAQIPSAVTTAAKDMQPPITYARLEEAPNHHWPGGSALITVTRLIGYLACKLKNKNPQLPKLIIGEIGLIDLPVSEVDTMAGFINYIFSGELAVPVAHFIKELKGQNIISAPVLRDIIDNAPFVERIHFSSEEIDNILLNKMLYIVAAILWGVLPKRLKTQWSAQFEHLGHVYYRNLLRMYQEKAGDEGRAEFFNQATFADTMAFYWAGEVSRLHLELSGGDIRRLVDPYRQFLDDVMAHVQRQKDKYGTAFVVV